MEETRLSLLEKIRNPDDTASWAEFCRIYEPLLFAYVRKRGRDRGLGWDDHDVSDVVQEVFVKLYRTMAAFKLDHVKGRFRTYLWTVTVNAMTDRVRAEMRRGRRERLDETDRPAPRVHDEGEVRLEDIADRGAADPDERWIAEYREAVFKAVLDDVKAEVIASNPKKWASFEEHELKGRPAGEVAAELEISANLVYQNTFRVHRTVRERCLEKYDEGLGDGSERLPD